MIGETISHYRITRELGAGGMGIVYEAVDTKLDRKVALKFLPPQLVRESDAKARFKREGITASALDHPNICTIHEIDETADGRIFIAMARYQGETLKERIARGPLALDEARTIARQVAEGLREAHAHDIVHRDIKPANIFITGNGLVKILDFGLAKLAGMTQLTQTGATMGTGHYMSPEQAAGREADHRTDLWSLGVVLYEMVTGRVPFGGDNLQSVLYGIQNRDPDPLADLRPEIPRELALVIRRCLEKDRDSRFPSSHDLLAALGPADGPTDYQSPSITTTLPAASRMPGRKRILAATVGGVVLAASAVMLMRGLEGVGPDPVRSAGTAKATPFLASGAPEIDPAWSSAGNLIAYAAPGKGSLDVWLSDLEGSNPLNLTRAPRSIDRFPAWSPPGDRIAFFSDRDGPGIYTMTVTGGNVRRVVAVDPRLPGNGTFFIQWVDGDRLIYGDRNAEGRPDIHEYDLASDQIRCLTTHSTDGAYFGDLNDRGTHLLYQRPWLGLDVEIFVQDQRTGEVILLPIKGRYARWAGDQESILVVSSREGTRDLWTVPFDPESGESPGPAKRLTTALALGRIAPEPGGPRLVATRGSGSMDVWEFPTHTGPVTELSQGRRLTDDGFDHGVAAWLPDGSGFLEVSDRRGSMDLWRVDLADGRHTRLRAGPVGSGIPSPEGRWIIVNDIQDDGRTYPFIMSADGSGYRELAPELRDGFVLAVVTGWSQRGDRLSVHGKKGEDWQVGVMEWNPDDGTVGALTVLPFGASIPFLSPDGRFLVVHRTVDGQRDIFVTDPEGLSVTRLTDDERMEWVAGWEPEPSRIYFKDGDTDTMYRIAMGPDGKPTSEPEVWIEGSEEWQIRQFLDFRDGRAIGPVGQTDTDLWLLELVADTR